MKKEKGMSLLDRNKDVSFNQGPTNDGRDLKSIMTPVEKRDLKVQRGLDKKYEESKCEHKKTQPLR